MGRTVGQPRFLGAYSWVVFRSVQLGMVFRGVQLGLVFRGDGHGFRGVQLGMVFRGVKLGMVVGAYSCPKWFLGA